MGQAQKSQFVEAMRADVARAPGVLFIDYTGLTVLKVNELRASLRAAKVRLVVVKNTLMSRVLDGQPYAAAQGCLKGTPTGVVLGFEDPVTPAKLVYEFAKTCDKVRVKGGIVDNGAITPVEAEALSKLPSQKELQGSIVALAKSPGGKLAGALKGPSGRIVGAIDALAERLGDGGAAEGA